MQTNNAILQEVHEEEWKKRSIRVFFKRDDLIHPEISGNKWRKLKYHLELCFSRKNEGILTFGGAYSNHLLACAAACKLHDLKSIGIVRGDELTAESNETLSRCAELGMELHFVSREEYQMRADQMYQQEWLDRFPNYLLVEEGGAGYYGMIGCQQILNEIEQPFDEVWTALGTGTTACGLLMGLSAAQQLHIVPVLKGFEVETTIRSSLLKVGMESEWVEEGLKNTRIHPEFHFGGYGKYTAELLDFIRSFYQKHQIPLDPIYTGKAVFALCDELKTTGRTNATILFIHTGGIQGVRAIEEKTGISLFS